MQRQVAARLDVDVAYVCKMESNEKPVSRQHIKTLAQFLGGNEEEMNTLWLADKIYAIVKDEDLAERAIRTTADVIRKERNY